MAFLETRGMLAKLLATENLIITHNVNATTASFDTESRELTLPVLKTDNENVYNMFVAHECSHALNTPIDWREIIPNNVPFDFVNVVEDVRIEKLIQSKFPGLRTDFSKGYDFLHVDDFFGINQRDVNTLTFIDRINLHFKLGARAVISFSDEEQLYVDKVDKCVSYLDVVEVSKELADFINSKGDTKPENNQEPNVEGEGGESDQSSQMKTDDDSNENETPESGGNDDMDSDQEPNENVSETQRNADESLKNMTSKWGEDYSYVKAPTEGLDFIIGVDELRDSYTHTDNFEYVEYERARFNNYLSSIKRDVNFMVQQFEMKKSADAYSRTQTHKTGELNMNLLHSYKLTDDIFLRQSTTPDGKNHGMVMYLDWSGSMSQVLHQTIKQILMLVQYCRKIQIPFEVYSFTSGNMDDGRRSFKPSYDGEIILKGMVRMVQVLTSSAKRGDLEQDMFHLWCRSKGRVYSSIHMEMGGTPLDNAMFALPDIIKRFRDNTKAQKVSVVLLTDGESSPISVWNNHTTSYGDSYLRTRSTWQTTTMIRSGSQVYPVGYGRASSGSVARWLESNIDDITITNIYLGCKAACEYYVSNYDVTLDTKEFDKSKSAVVTTKNGWPLITLIHPKSFGESQQEIEVEAGETKAKIRTALKKMLSSKSANKMVLTALVDQFS